MHYHSFSDHATSTMLAIALYFPYFPPQFHFYSQDMNLQVWLFLPCCYNAKLSQEIPSDILQHIIRDTSLLLCMGISLVPSDVLFYHLAWFIVKKL